MSGLIIIQMERKITFIAEDKKRELQELQEEPTNENKPEQDPKGSQSGSTPPSIQNDGSKNSAE